METYSRIAIKVGSNVLTRLDGRLDLTRMSALVDQIAELRRMDKEVILISSGAVAAGKGEMKECTGLDAVSARQLFSAVGQIKLMNRYDEFFGGYGLRCGQVLTMKESFSTRRHYLNQKQCMEVMLEHGIVPVVNENDTVSVTELMFTDNDELSGLVATMMGVDVLLILSNVDGVYDGDPALPTSALLREVVPDARLDTDSIVQTSRSSLGRGGMITKFRMAQKVASEGITVIIANGKREHILTDILLERNEVPYTRFLPGSHPVSGVKKWIAHSEGFTKGKIQINEGAYRALLSSQAASLLPVGVVAVEGQFEKDDIVQILAPDGSAFALGKISCSAEEVQSRMGLQGERPFVHYNNLYIEWRTE